MMIRKALFLDRDGVINYDYGHVFRIIDFDFIPYIFEFCKIFQNLGYEIIIITNQAGIAKEYYSVGDFKRLSSWMVSEFEKKDIKIQKVYFCPHHPDYTGPCDCRKPKPGMILKAISEFGIDASRSFFVGDKESDQEAAVGAGLPYSHCFLFKGNFKSIEDRCKSFIC